MTAPDLEYFHYRNKSVTEIEYHNHDFYEVYFFISGKVTYLIEGKSYRLVPGDILLVNNRELHKPVVETDEPYERIVIWMNDNFIKKNSTGNCDLGACFETGGAAVDGGRNLLRPGKAILSKSKEILSKFEKVYYGKDYGNEILCGIYLVELLVFLNKACMDSEAGFPSPEESCDDRIEKLILHINRNLSGDLSLDNLSSLFYTSKYHMLREFARNTGYTIYQYVRQKRLILAKSLLQKGCSVGEACEKSGFGNYSNFIRCFKSRFGMPPKLYAVNFRLRR